MKTIILAFLLFFSISLTAQHLNQPNYKIIESNETGTRIEYYSPEFENSKVEYTDYKNADTLFLNVEYSGASINIIGPYYNYMEDDITWLNGEETFGYILLESEHTFNIVVGFNISPNKYMIFTEQYNLNDTDTLEYFTNQAIYELTVNPVDINGTPFNQLNGDDHNNIYFLIPHWLGFYPENNLISNAGSIFTSFISDTVKILVTSLFYDVVEENIAFFIEYPSLAGINQNIVLENDPADYKSTNIQMFLTEENVIKTNIGYVWGIMYKGTLGFFDFFGAGILKEINNISYWNGNIYMIRQNNDLYKSTVYLQGNTYKAGYVPFTRSATPFLEVINDSIGAYYYMTPPQNLYKTAEIDTLKFSETPVTQCYNWYNNSSDSLIFAIGGAYGMLNEFTRALPGYTHHEVKDESGNVVYSGDNAEAILYFVTPGIYTVEFTNNSSPLKTGYGTSKMISTFDLAIEDSSPPSMDAVQFRNADNVPDYMINKGESVFLYMNAYDFIDKYDTLYESSYFVYQPVLDDSTRVYIKEYDQNDWQEVPHIKYYEDTIYGSYYRADLSAYTNIDSSALDIRIKLQDYSGNKSEFILSPAILVDNFIVTGFDEKEYGSSILQLNVYPNPAKERVTFEFMVISSLVETIFRAAEREIIVIRNILGDKITELPVQDRRTVWNCKEVNAGIYFYSVEMNGTSYSGKLVIN